MQAFLIDNYLILKAFHIIMVIAWMAGMMYLPRLYVYHHQAAPGSDAAQFFVMMERRLLKGIMTPSMVIVWLLAILMLVANPAIASTGWFLVKLGCVIGITAIHGFYAAARKKFEAGETPRSERFWRILNEGPFILMIVAVVMAVVEPF